MPEKLDRCLYPGCRHHTDNEHKKFTITSEFVLCWIAYLIPHFGVDKHSAGNLWQDPPYGVSIPYLQCLCFHKAAYPHHGQFEESHQGKIRVQGTLQGQLNIVYVMKGTRKAWIAGKHVTIDKSVIRYTGQAINYHPVHTGKADQTQDQGVCFYVVPYLMLFYLL